MQQEGLLSLGVGLPTIPLRGRSLNGHIEQYKRVSREYGRCVRKLVNRPGFFESVPAFEDALQGVRCLVNVPGVKVVLGTRLWEFSKRDALVGFRRFISEMRRWSVKHLGECSFGEHLYRIRSGDLDRPVPVAVVPDWSRFQADAFIDDRPHEACM
ncbi:hypothetical protein FOZ62_012029 [Perkinsus olseni]|uniref:Uncharacterized protein n=1 Tax=Perkinsus olseni TaxID=32597 RepID=A0A7J6SIN0_PEROL|nr:hypothetical protein FOZ62_012029 [Perkinsus olseni]